jgi:hypothetical protein
MESAYPQPMRTAAVLAVAAVFVAGCGGSDKTSSSSQARLVPVPNIVGMHTKRAEAVLKAKGLEADVGWVDPDLRPNGEGERRPCAGVPGQGPVSVQEPIHGVGRFEVGTVIHLRTGCPPQSSLPPCSDSELKLTTVPSGGTGFEWVWVYLEHVGGPPCRLGADLSLSIEEDRRHLSIFENNPATVHLKRSMGIGEELTVTWPRYGCLSIKHVRYVARLDGLIGSADGSVICASGDPNATPGLALSKDVRFSAETGRRAYERALARTRR